MNRELWSIYWAIVLGIGTIYCAMDGAELAIFVAYVGWASCRWAHAMLKAREAKEVDGE